MVQPRATRSKRVAPPSDDEDEKVPANGFAEAASENAHEHAQSPITRNAEKPPAASESPLRRISTGSQSAAASPSTTPKRSKKKSTSKQAATKPNSKTIYSFFNAATQKQQDKTDKHKQATSPQDEGVKDAIEDDSGDERRSHERSAGSLALRKRSWEDGSASTQHNGQAELLGPSKKFLRGADGQRTPSISGQRPEHDSKPWTEKYGPSNLDELVVHKRKVADVRDWFEKVRSYQSDKRVLVLKGAAGNGKTVTVNLLAKILGYEIVEWKNSGMSDFTSEGYTSMAEQFDDFINRGRKYNVLELDGDISSSKDSHQDSSAVHADADNQLLLVEEYPTSMTSSSSALQRFRSTILQFLAVNAPSRKDFFTKASGTGEQVTPVVMIVSESVLSNSGSSSDNFTAHRLLGQDILNHAGVSVIEFNAVAPTFITKALNLVVQKHGRSTGQYLYPPTEVIEKIAEIGDVRNAVSTLEFFCLQSDATSFHNKPSPKKSKKSKVGAGSKPTASSNVIVGSSGAAVSLLSLRESTLGLFHATGRVVHNKRSVLVDPGYRTAELESELPEHLHDMARPLPTEVDIERLIDETGTDVSKFIATLHENFMLSCYPTSQGPRTVLDSAIGCLEALSDADIGSQDRRGRRGYYASNVDTMLQEDVAFQISVRGILFHLPYPVKRQAPSHWAKADTHRMFYPTSLRLWRKKEELEGKLDWFVERAFDGRLVSELQQLDRKAPQSASAGRSQTNAIPIFKSRATEYESQAKEEGSAPATNEENDSPTIPYINLGSGHSARQEMLLERLPYLSMISKKKAASSALSSDIEAITRFSGIGHSTTEEDEDAEAEADSTPKSSSRTKDGRRGLFGTPAAFSFRGAGRSKSESDLDMQKLVLSDDDIEDD